MAGRQALARAPAAPASEPKAELLLLSCMDFRLTDHISRFMKRRGLKNAYDHVVLAGASLGAVCEGHRAWEATFWEHLEFAIDHHGIGRIMVLDHRDCGAYKTILQRDFALDPDTETTVHTRHLLQLRGAIHRRFPGFEVELLLMALNGSVEEIASHAEQAASPTTAPGS